MVMDVHRQLLFAMQSADLYDINDALIASRDINTAFMEAADKYQDVGFARSSSD